MMNFIAQNALYIYMFVMIMIVMFDVLSIVYRIYNRYKIKRLENKLTNSLKNLKLSRISDKYKKKLKRHLKKIDYLIAFFSMIEKLTDNKREKYLKNIKEIFNDVYLHYSRGDVQRLIFLIHHFSLYPILCEENDLIKQNLVVNCTSPIVYLREKSLLALYQLGEKDLIIEAFYQMNIKNIYHNSKLLTDGLLSFKGNKEERYELDKLLLDNINDYNKNYKVAIINYMTYKNVHHEEIIYNIMKNKREDKEVVIQCVRYFKKIKYDKVLPLLLEFIKNDYKQWELSVVTASCLETYGNDKKIVDALFKATTSSNWYLRKNASHSLVRLLSENEIKDIINLTDDKYAKEALEYQLIKSKVGGKNA